GRGWVAHIGIERSPSQWSAEPSEGDIEGARDLLDDEPLDWIGNLPPSDPLKIPAVSFLVVGGPRQRGEYGGWGTAQPREQIVANLRPVPPNGAQSEADDGGRQQRRSDAERRRDGGVARFDAKKIGQNCQRREGLGWARALRHGRDVKTGRTRSRRCQRSELPMRALSGGAERTGWKSRHGGSCSKRRHGRRQHHLRSSGRQMARMGDRFPARWRGSPDRAGFCLAVRWR